ncbi:hypothetical protein GCM10010191_52920 [Actinomadura vinacea]|uniref:Uncharacterized protein n=1 Tax=Actinomadura vinacea TaxID=115336 RepID=A0ABN3JJK2_9ACTN
MADRDWEAEFEARLVALAAAQEREFIREVCEGGSAAARRTRVRWGLRTAVTATVAAGLALIVLGAYHVLDPANKSGVTPLADPSRSATGSVPISFPETGFVTDDTTRSPMLTNIEVGGKTYTSGWLLTEGIVFAERTIELETPVRRGDLTAVVAALGTSGPCLWTATIGGIRKSVSAPADGYKNVAFSIDRLTDGIVLSVERPGRPQGRCLMTGIEVHSRPSGQNERSRPSPIAPDDDPAETPMPTSPPPSPEPPEPVPPSKESPSTVQPEPTSPTPTPVPAERKEA